MTNIEEENLPTYMVWVTIEGADESPADNGFEYVSDAVDFADTQAEKLRTEKVANWEVAVYDTFSNQNAYVVESGE